MKLLKEWSPFALFIIVMLLLRVYVWQPVIVEGHSMDPTLADKERLVIIKTARIKRQDIVVAKEYNKEDQSTKISSNVSSVCLVIPSRITTMCSQSMER